MARRKTASKQDCYPPPTPGPHKAYFAETCDLAMETMSEVWNLRQAEGEIRQDAPKDALMAALRAAFDEMIANQRTIEMHLQLTESACHERLKEVAPNSATQRRIRTLEKEITEAKAALEEIQCVRNALARGDARAAAMAGFFAGYHAHAMGAYEPESWAAIAQRNASKLSSPNRTQGQSNRQAVRAAHTKIIASQPDIEHKSLMSLLREATGLKDRTIYKHLSQKSTARL